MSYTCGFGNIPRVAYFSNPDVEYMGKPTGTVTNDNARKIRDNMVRCYSDRPDRIMRHVTRRHKMTIKVCQEHCAGSAYFGVQNGWECWCSGTGSANYAFDRHGRSTGCTRPCIGNADEMCGGSWAMNVYKNV